MHEVLIVGGGIGGLTLALELCRRGIGCRVVESAPEIKAVGVGVNLLPHAMRAYAELGLQPALERVAVETAEAAFFNRFGQLIYAEPRGRAAGYPVPEVGIEDDPIPTGFFTQFVTPFVWSRLVRTERRAARASG